MDVLGIMADELHGHALRDSGSLEHGGYGGTQGVEGFAVPDATAARGGGADQTNAVSTHQRCEVAAGAGELAELRVHPMWRHRLRRPGRGCVPRWLSCRTTPAWGVREGARFYR